MKKIIILFLTFLITLTFVGCNKNSMNYIIQHEPNVTGIVKEVHDNYIQIFIQNEGYPSGADCNVSLDVENKDGLYSPIQVGDEVVVYFDGGIAESYPMQINKVYAIILKEPANRNVNESE